MKKKKFNYILFKMKMKNEQLNDCKIQWDDTEFELFGDQGYG